MKNPAATIIGLPGSGKTTFLAALWHLLTSHEIETQLKFVSLRAGNAAYLNSIAAKWRDAKRQERTSVSGDQIVSMTMAAENESAMEVAFPDLAGERFLQLWEDRECAEDLIKQTSHRGALLFIHADKLKSPLWITDIVEQSADMGIPHKPSEQVAWSPALAPTQVQVVDILQTLDSNDTNKPLRKLAVMLSAWDKVADEGLNPDEFLMAKMPLLHQFLSYGLSDSWERRIYGLSAQGGDYDGESGNSPSAEKLRELSCPSERVSVVYQDQTTSDLTEPLRWLLN